VWLHSYFVCNVCLFVFICSFRFLFLFATVKVNKVVQNLRQECGNIDKLEMVDKVNLYSYSLLLE